jgi:serine phosphatase RsbU (regulator of sigma subunit)
VCLDEKSRTGEIWIGGTPECFLLGPDGQCIQRFASQQLPLGIIETNDDLLKTDRFTWDDATQLVIFSDGLLEAANPENHQFGDGRLLSTLLSSAPVHRHQAVRSALNHHLAGLAAHDDVSLLLIDCLAKD